jgi:hypothetical protein
MAGSVERPPGSRGVQSSALHFQLYRQGLAAPVRWRVLSANNRDMGRGARDFPDEDACVAGIAYFLAHLDGLVVSLSRTPENRWAFRLIGPDELVATSGHAFDRRTRCERAAARFIELVPDAEIRRGVAVLTSSSWPRSNVRADPVGRPNVAPRWTPAGGSAARLNGSAGAVPSRVGRTR